MTTKETVFRCTVPACGFETPNGNEIAEHLYVKHTEIRLETTTKRGTYITVLKKAGEKK